MSTRSPESACHGKRDSTETITVLGIGNLLWADEGFGVRCIEALQQRYEFAPHVQLIDGGTQGLYLIQHVQQAGKLLIFDAIDYGLSPGTLKLVENDEVPRFMGAKKMSLHQTGFQEVLMLALLTERYPKDVLLIGCQPEEGSQIPGIRKWPQAYLPKIFDASRVDQVENVSQAEAENMTRRLACEEGIFAGISSGGGVHIALRIAATVENAVIVSIICDRGDRYLSTGVFPA